MFKPNEHRQAYSNQKIKDIAAKFREKLDIPSAKPVSVGQIKQGDIWKLEGFPARAEILNKLSDGKLKVLFINSDNQKNPDTRGLGDYNSGIEYYGEECKNFFGLFVNIAKFKHPEITTDVHGWFKRHKEIKHQRESNITFQMFYELSYLVLDYFPDVNLINKFYATPEINENLAKHITCIHRSYNDDYDNVQESGVSKADSMLFAKEMIMPEDDAKALIDFFKSSNLERENALNFLLNFRPLPIAVAREIINDNWK